LRLYFFYYFWHQAFSANVPLFFCHRTKQGLSGIAGAAQSVGCRLYHRENWLGARQWAGCGPSPPCFLLSGYGDKEAGSWNWQLTSMMFRCQEYMELYFQVQTSLFN
jgi:hypothetical protein